MQVEVATGDVIKCSGPDLCNNVGQLLLRFCWQGLSSVSYSSRHTALGPRPIATVGLIIPSIIGLHCNTTGNTIKKTVRQKPQQMHMQYQSLYKTGLLSSCPICRRLPFGLCMQALHPWRCKYTTVTASGDMQQAMW